MTVSTEMGTRGSVWSTMKMVVAMWLFISVYPASILGVNQCYSCMSQLYHNLWEPVGYDRMYFRPQTFTDHCQNPDEKQSAIGKIDCDDLSSCITIIQRIQLGSGMRTYIRGCYNSIFRWGFNKTGRARQLQSNSKPFCDRFNLTELIAGFRPHESELTVCSCKGHLCNGAQSPHRPPRLNRTSTIAGAAADRLLALMLTLVAVTVATC